MDWGQLVGFAEPFAQPMSCGNLSVMAQRFQPCRLWSSVQSFYTELSTGMRLSGTRRSAAKKWREINHKPYMIKKRTNPWRACNQRLRARCHHVFHRRFHIIRGKFCTCGNKGLRGGCGVVLERYATSCPHPVALHNPCRSGLVSRKGRAAAPAIFVTPGAAGRPVRGTRPLLQKSGARQLPRDSELSARPGRRCALPR